MQDKIIRKFLLGFMQIHILHHAQKEAIYGSWMIEELSEHGYDISPGTLYPMLRSMETSGLLLKEDKIVEGKIRKYYTITDLGGVVLKETRIKAFELFKEINE